MKMVSMELSDKEQKEITEPSAEDAPKYPYGLSLHVGKESLDNLKIDNLPSVGTKMILHAEVEVASTSEREHESGKDKNMELQITSMALAEPEDKPDAKDVLYRGD